MTTASSQHLLEAEALNYLEGRGSFADLYNLAADVLPELVHAGIDRSTSLAGAILNAEVEYSDDDLRRQSIARALATLGALTERHVPR